MILPNKYIDEKNTLIYGGALILNELNSPRSISYLWEYFKNEPSISTYERFILTLDMLFIFGLIDIKQDRIMRVKNDS